MRRVPPALLAAAVLAFAALPAAAAPPAGTSETPIHFMKRLFKEPVDVLTGKTPTLHKATLATSGPAATPPTAAPDMPLPRLRPGEGEVTVVASAAPVTTPAPVVPTPHLRPEPGAVVAAAPATDVPVPPVADIPAPPAAEVAAAPAADGTGSPPPPEVKLAALPPVPTPAPPAPPKLIRPPPAATSFCGAAIAKLGVTATPLAVIREGANNACTVPEPVAIAALDDGTVDFSSKAIVDCSLAETLADWIDKKVEPAAFKIYGEHLTGLRIADAYSCRTRDNIEGAKLSEHAKGNAIDISAFRVGTRWIAVGPGWQGGGDDLAFLTKVRKSACGPFKTVLGPGADAYHTDHFHLDLAKRRTSGPSRGLACP